MNRIVFQLCAAAFLVSCQTTSEKDADLVMSREEIMELVKTGKAQFFSDTIQPASVLSADALITATPNALFSEAGLRREHPDGKVEFLVKKGSLEDNIQRLMTQRGWGALYMEKPDYHLDKNFLMSAGTVEESLYFLISDYPLYMCGEENGDVTIINTKSSHLN